LLLDFSFRQNTVRVSNGCIEIKEREMKKEIAIRSGALAFSVLLFGHAHAQISLPMPSGMNVGDAHAILWNDIPSRQKRPSREVKRGPTPNIRPSQQGVPLTFTVSAQRRSANYAEMISGVRRIDRAQGDALQQLIGLQDWNTGFAGEMRRQNLNALDLSDIYAVWIINSWKVSRGMPEEATDEEIRLVARQVRRRLPTMPGFSALSNDERQRYADVLTIQTIVAIIVQKAAQQQPDKLPAVIASTKRNALGFGVDLDRLTYVTGVGFTER
jgi:hypothetical protein